VRDAGGANLLDLTCGLTYFGGGAPDTRSFPTLAGNETVLKVVACADRTLALGPLSAVEVGGANPDRHCTKAGCLFGNAPTPILAVPSFPGIHSCIVQKFADDVEGTADCQTGSVRIDFPLDSAVYVGGDVLAARAGVQPCPICDPGPGTCLGGPNAGLACTPFGPLVGNDAYPVSHDCPPDPAVFIGIALSFDFVFDSATSIRSAAPSGTQQRVFCGFCRDTAGAQCFEGDPSGACPPSPTPGTPHRCRTDADCAEPFESCDQQTQRAFAFPAAQTITQTGTPAGAIETGGPEKVATLVSTLCVSPTFSPADLVGDLPSPAATSTSQSLVLLP
jgi:hypothetical protein